MSPQPSALQDVQTLRPIDGTSTELRQRLASGELLKAGNRVSIVTTDHKRHQFVVTGIDAGRIEGRTDSVPEDEAVSLRKRQVSRGETLALVGGVVLARAWLSLPLHRSR